LNVNGAISISVRRLTSPSSGSRLGVFMYQRAVDGHHSTHCPRRSAIGDELTMPVHHVTHVDLAPMSHMIVRWPNCTISSFE
jgi:hypothetical protein